MRIGVDLGGTKIEGLAIAPDGSERLRRRVPTPQQDYDGTVNAIASLVADLERELGGRATVGVGIPGTVSPATGLVKGANSTWLNGKPLDRDLSARLDREVRTANDANCFALSEASDGAAAGARVVFGVILGTGVGGGIVVDGKVLSGPNGIAGEWGHTPLPYPRDDEHPGPACYCGRRACVERFLAGPHMRAEHRALGGDDLGPGDIAARAAAGDARCEATMARYEDRLARGLAVVIDILDPDVIVLGGGLSNLDRLYANVPTLWGRYVFSDTVRTRLVKNHHGDSSGVRGAAWLWPAT